MALLQDKRVAVLHVPVCCPEYTLMYAPATHRYEYGPFVADDITLASHPNRDWGAEIELSFYRCMSPMVIRMARGPQ